MLKRKIFPELNQNKVLMEYLLKLIYERNKKTLNCSEAGFQERFFVRSGVAPKL